VALPLAVTVSRIRPEWCDHRGLGGATPPIKSLLLREVAYYYYREVQFHSFEACHPLKDLSNLSLQPLQSLQSVITELVWSFGATYTYKMYFV
jgi:hypothetical protein